MEKKKNVKLHVIICLNKCLTKIHKTWPLGHKHAYHLRDF